MQKEGRAFPIPFEGIGMRAKSAPVKSQSESQSAPVWRAINGEMWKREDLQMVCLESRGCFPSPHAVHSLPHSSACSSTVAGAC